MTSDPNVADPVKLAAIKDALDISGLAAKNAVSVEIGITKPWEAVFEGISEIIAGPRDPKKPAALAIESTDAPIKSADDDEIMGEFDDDPEPDEIEDDPLRIQRDRESESDNVIDVEIVAAEYTDAPMTIGSGTATLDDPDSSLSGAGHTSR